MIGPYLTLLRTPGAANFSAAGLVGRLPISMIGLGIVLLETSKGESYAIAGSIAAAFAVAAAFGGPVVSGYVDRHGQHRVLPFAAGLNAAFMLLLLVGLQGDWPLPAVLVIAACAGVFLPNMGALVRARWAYVASDRIHLAYSWESILDEVVFVVGPPLVTVLALNVHPAAGLPVSLVLVLVGSLWLTPQRRTEPPPQIGHTGRSGMAAANPGMPVLLLAFLFIGGVFGSFEVVTVAFAEEAGAPSATGLLLALYALGSLTAGLIYGVLRPPALHGVRLVWMLTAMAAVTSALPLANSVPALAVLAVLAGVSVSPVLISGTALVERIVPSRQLTEGITWTSTGLALGLAIAAPTAGWVIDTYGASTAYLVTAGCAVMAAVIAWTGQPSIRRAEQPA